MAAELPLSFRMNPAFRGGGRQVGNAINCYPLEHYCLNKINTRSSLGPLKSILVCLTAGVVLVGCAGTPPIEQYAVTRSAVNGAVSAGGTEFAAVEMKSAQDKFKAAELALHAKKYSEARCLAEQAEWDARVAERKAQAAKAKRAVDDARQGVQDLREEGMRAAS